MQTIPTRPCAHGHGMTPGVEIVGVRQSEDCQKFGWTAEDGVSGSPTDIRQIREYFYQFLFTMSIFDNSSDPYWSSRKW